MFHIPFFLLNHSSHNTRCVHLYLPSFPHYSLSCRVDIYRVVFTCMLTCVCVYVCVKGDISMLPVILRRSVHIIFARGILEEIACSLQSIDKSPNRYVNPPLCDVRGPIGGGPLWCERGGARSDISTLHTLRCVLRQDVDIQTHWRAVCPRGR